MRWITIIALATGLSCGSIQAGPNKAFKAEVKAERKLEKKAAKQTAKQARKAAKKA